MIAFIHKIQNQRNERERGAADMIAALTLTPIILFLLFAIIDISLWLNTKAHIEAATRDGTRIAAMWGGAGNTPLNTTGKNIPSSIKSKLYNGKSCTRSNCTRVPKVSCTPSKVRTAGSQISCTTTYYYKSLFGKADLLGFGGITSKPIVYKSTAISETGYR